MMATKQIKLIATDLDGTLLQNYLPDCSQEAIALITQLVQQGVYVLPASGRQYPNLRRMFAQVDGELMYLCENGALVMYRDQVMLKRSFERPLALELCHMVMDDPDCEVLISGERTSYLIPKSEEYVTYMRDHIKNDVTIVGAPEEIAEPIIKVSYYTQAENRDRVTAFFEQQIDDRCLIVVSGNEWVDFAPKGTSKGAALAAIGEQMGIAPEEMMAFGDNENDRSMLELVGHPYLMRHCNPSMGDVDAKRCDRVEDVLRELLEHGI